MVQPLGATRATSPPTDPAVERWFLSPAERHNPATEIDRRHRDGRAWTVGNLVTPRIDGATYFKCLHEVLDGLSSGDRVWFTDWRGDSDEVLDESGVTLGEMFTALPRRGIDLRGLVWRSHPDETRFSQEQNFALTEMVDEAGGQIHLDERVRRGGSHHQKLVLVRRPHSDGADVAFVGGIDLCHGRRDDGHHLGDPQPYELDERHGSRPAWHDAQEEIRGPAVGDLDLCFRERWEDPTPLDHRNPWRARLRRIAHEPPRPSPLPPMPPDPGVMGTCAVQVLRTYPAKRPPYPFAPQGERSIARAYAKAFRRARSIIYVEDQYLWSREVADVLASGLRRHPELRLVVVVPRYPERGGSFSGPTN